MKFSKGEIAIHIGGGMIAANTEVEILECGPWKPFEKVDPNDGRFNSDACDYLIRSSYTGRTHFTADKDLRKRPADDDQLFTKWARDHLITEPLVETMTRTMRNLETFTQEAGRGS